MLPANALTHTMLPRLINLFEQFSLRAFALITSNKIWDSRC